MPAVRQALAVLTDDDVDEPAALPTRPAEAAHMQREGDVWALTFAGRTVRVRDLKGLGDLAVLLRRAGEEVHCLELMGATDVGGSGTGPVLDEQARREYQARILDLQRDVDEAHEANDPARAERAELELDALVTELSKAFGLGGRARSGGSSVERARTAVTFRIRAAIKKVTRAARRPRHPPDPFGANRDMVRVPARTRGALGRRRHLTRVVSRRLTPTG